MIQATCIQKFKKNNRIYGYRLQDSQGNTKDVTPDQLKTAIQNQQINIINLTLTSDNRLIATTPTQQPQTQAPQISEEQKIINLITKAKTLGTLKEIPTYCKHKCYLIYQSPTQHLIYIPDDVTKLNYTDWYRLDFTKHIEHLRGALKVVGGKNLKDASNMFKHCQAQSIDLSNFNTSNVTDMRFMFHNCQAQSLDLSSFDTSNVEDMEEMFGGCQTKSLDISNFNTSNVRNMEHMFHYCQAESLDLRNFDTSKVTNMRFIFGGCQAKFIDISSFITSKVIDMQGMFYECQAQIKATDPKILKVYKER